jgi:PAS domain S-box-containing protein
MTEIRTEIPTFDIAPVRPGEPVGKDNFRHFAEAIPTLAWTAEPDGTVDYLSPQFLQFVGADKDAADALDWSQYIHPDDLAYLSDVWNNAVRERNAYACEFRLQDDNGGYRWFSARGIPVFDSLGSMVKWYGVTIDIDAHKHAEIALHKAAEARDRFIAILSHELRNPLAAISTSSQVLKSDRCNEIQRADALALLGRQISHLTRLVDDTLDISRLTTGRMSLAPAPVDLKRIARECCEEIAPLAKENGFTLNMDSDTNPVWVNGDDTRLSQCLSNLIDNSMKFSPSPDSIRVSVGESQGTAILEVQDFGIGMEEEDIEALFMPFEQGVSARLAGKDGLGLGLAVLKELVDLHDGQVEVVSPGRGKGTMFRIKLATCEAPAQPKIYKPKKPKTANKPEAATRSVLLIEDNLSVLRSLEMFFELEGHKVRSAVDGEAAFECISEEIPDIIFCDLSLTGEMMGWDVAERIVREIPASKRPLLIALSGHTQAKYVRKSLDAGFDRHLSKPTSPAELRNCLEQIVG